MLTINLFNGLVYGALLIVMSSGLALIYGLRRVVNFAHGEFFMLGAYVTYYGMTLMGMGYISALLVATLLIVLAHAVHRHVDPAVVLDAANIHRQARVLLADRRVDARRLLQHFSGMPRWVAIQLLAPDQAFGSGTHGVADLRGSALQ